MSGPIRITNPCGEKTNFPHFGTNAGEVPFETIAGPCTPLYRREKKVSEMPPECLQCIYNEVEMTSGGLNNCGDLCIPLRCPDLWARQSETYRPSGKEWCELAKCVEDQRKYDKGNEKCKNPCGELDAVLFNKGQLSSKDYC